MKKLLLILSFLASQLLAVECTEEQYKPYFDKNNDRYMYSYSQASDKSKILIDKKSVSYDKKNNRITCWTIMQTISNPELGIVKIRWEYNLNNNTIRVLTDTGTTCNGKIILEEQLSTWYDIEPESGHELVLNSLKKYLNIK